MIHDETPLGDRTRLAALDAVAESYGYDSWRAFARADLASGGTGGSRAVFDLVVTAIAPLQAELTAATTAVSELLDEVVAVGVWADDFADKADEAGEPALASAVGEVSDKLQTTVAKYLDANV